MSFYIYRQNNSGGSFDIDHERGIERMVIVEAEDENQADSRAVSIGLYWDGCDSGLDCSCCGDRWSPASSYGRHDEPEVYGKPVQFGPIKSDSNSLSDYNGFVHYLNGDVKSFSQSAW